MRRAFVAALVMLAASTSPASAGPPEPGLVIAMAQQLVTRHLLPPDRQFQIGYDVARLHPQPGGDFWAVVGGLAMKEAGVYRQHVYVAAVRLVCPRPEDFQCWHLEKFALDERILVDKPAPKKL